MADNSKSTAMRLARAFVRDNGMTLSDAIKCAWRNVRLKAALRAGPVRFTFQKADGTIRAAFGTLEPSAIAYTPNGTGRPMPDTVQRYWDLDKGAYRAFSKAALLSVAV